MNHFCCVSEMLGYEFLVDGTEYVIMGAIAQKEALQSQNVESFLGIKLFPRWTNMVNFNIIYVFYKCYVLFTFGMYLYSNYIYIRIL